MVMKSCPNCRHLNNVTLIRCPHCGTSLCAFRTGSYRGDLLLGIGIGSIICIVPLPFVMLLVGSLICFALSLDQRSKYPVFANGLLFAPFAAMVVTFGGFAACIYGAQALHIRWIGSL